VEINRYEPAVNTSMSTHESLANFLLSVTRQIQVGIAGENQLIKMAQASANRKAPTSLGISALSETLREYGLIS
jgi:hypothetical protein